jgi:putative PIN family toxin of toxin-antitoxin system
MIRVVVDTGVIVSAALLPRSVPRQALDTATAHGLLLFSETTFTEVAEVLRRPKFSRYVSEQKRAEFLHALIDFAETVEVSCQVRQCRDPKDDKFLELASDGHATHIVSGDADLLVLKIFAGVPILSPAEFLAIMASQ